MNNNQTFDTNSFFVGGAGMFIQYHDIIRSVYLMAIIKMILNKSAFGLPISIISKLSLSSLIEWYMTRRFVNPLKVLDCNNIITDTDNIDTSLINYLNSDESLYSMAPKLNIVTMLSNYKHQHMTFPVYVYSDNYEKNIEKDIGKLFPDINPKYVYGDLKEILKTLPENYTYIFSSIEHVKNSCKCLNGKYSHILLSNDYRYNYKDNYTNFKYNLNELAHSYSNIRIGTTNSVNIKQLTTSFKQIIS